jgi:hypothetical protein
MNTHNCDASSQQQVNFGDNSPNFISNTIPCGDDQPTENLVSYHQDTLGEDASVYPPLPEQHYHIHPQEVGCQASVSDINQVTIIKEAKKLSLP